MTILRILLIAALALYAMLYGKPKSKRGHH